MQKHFALVKGNLYKVLEPLVRFVEGGEREWGSGVHVKDEGSIWVDEE
jgi:hypothetical protein